jgi:hypothetical protein
MPRPIDPHTSIALVRALQNDRRGVVSEADARRLVEVGLDSIRQSTDPQQAKLAALEVIRAAEKLAPSAGASRVLGRFLGQADAVVLQSGDAHTTAAAALLKDALKNSLGVLDLAGITIQRSAVQAGVTHIDAAVLHGQARLSVGYGQGNKPELRDVQFSVVPSLLDPAERSLLEEALTKDFGFRQAEVIAAAGAPDPQGGTNWQVWVRHGRPAKAENIGLQTNAAGQGTSMGSYRYDATLFRQQALHLAVAAGLHSAQQLGPPTDRQGLLEVLLNAQHLDPATFIALAAPGDSPVGFDASKEVQLEIPALHGDNVAYVTVNKQTGALRAELYN